MHEGGPVRVRRLGDAVMAEPPSPRHRRVPGSAMGLVGSPSSMGRSDPADGEANFLTSGVTTNPRPYSDSARQWSAAGMEPVPVNGKGAVPPGFMGYNDGVIDETQVRRWVETRPDRNVALRLTSIVGIDVDNYEHDLVQAGDAARSLARLEEQWGLLPETMRPLRGSGRTTTA